MDFIHSTQIRREDHSPVRRIVKLALGRISRSQDWRHDREIRARLAKWLSHSPPDRLSQAEIDHYRTGFDFAIYEADREVRREVYASRPFERTFQGMIFPLIHKVIEDDPTVESILEIGCYYGYNLHLLAREYPDRQVTGVDLFDWTPRLNDEFTETNLAFKAGYALDMLATGELQGDIVLCLSTATRFKPQEFRRYLDVIASQGRYLILNELLMRLPGNHVPDPAHVDESIPFVYFQSDIGEPPCFIHNYERIVRDAGWDVLHYHVHMPEWTDVYRVVMVARAPN